MDKHFFTPSVHDSSTLREWYDAEPKYTLIDIAHPMSDEFIDNSRKSQSDYFVIAKGSEQFSEKLDPKTCENLFKIYAKANGAWFIPPLMDWLYLDSKYYAENARDERINIPGTVSHFNWTWRMPVTVEKIFTNTKMISKIQKIVQTHQTTEV